MRITALAGGVGGARFLRGLLAAAPEAAVTVIGNVGDDMTMHGLRICPDLDTVMYTLGGGIHEGQGWGRVDETFGVADELKAYGVGPDWFTLGDKDIATHLVRTQMMGAGYPLSAVTEALCTRWELPVRLLPSTDERVETHVVIDDPEAPGGRRAVHFQEYWVRMHAPDARAIVSVGVEGAKPAPGVLEAIAEADVIVLPPSNPVVSIGTILDIPGIRQAVADAPAPVVGVGSTHGTSSGSTRRTSDRSQVTSPPARSVMVTVSPLNATRDADITRPLERTTRSARAGAARASPARTASATSRVGKVISLYFGSTNAWNTLTPNSLKS